MFTVKKLSSWTYHTSAGQSVSYGYAGAASGDLILKNPEGEDVTFHYQSAGVGKSVGFSTVSSSTKDSYSDGLIYVMDACHGDELTRQDIEGYFLSVEVSVGAALGESAAAMLLGLNSREQIEEIAKLAIKYGGGLGTLATAVRKQDVEDFSDGLSGYAVNRALVPRDPSSQEPLLKIESSAKALLITGSYNAGYQFTVGILGSTGRLWAEPPTPVDKITVKRKPLKTEVIIPADILFDFDKDTIKATAEGALESAGKVMKSHHVISVFLYGHTDSIGDDIYNVGLSNRRAGKVAQWLISHGYVRTRNVAWFGMGKSKPIASNNDSKGRERNRRVEIQIATVK